MNPPLCLIIPYTVASPKPVPFPCSLVVKKGSKIRALVSASIPIPLSATDRSTYCPEPSKWVTGHLWRIGQSHRLGQLAQFWEVMGQVRIVRRFAYSEKANTGVLGSTSLENAGETVQRKP